MFTLDQVHEVASALDPEATNPRTAGGGGGCYYTNNDGTPACIAGNIFAALGQTLPAWDSSDNVNAGVSTLPFSHLFDKAALDYLEMLQEHADLGDPWGECVALADNQHFGGV